MSPIRAAAGHASATARVRSPVRAFPFALAVTALAALAAGVPGCAPAGARSTADREADAPPSGPAPTGRAPEGVDGRVAEVVERGELPGVVVLVVRGDSVVYQASRGVTEAGGSTPMTADVVLRAAAITPLVHGLAAARLAHEGRLALDAPVAGLVPDLLAPVGAVSVEQLLTHTSGLALEFVRGPVTVDDIHVAARWLTPLDVVAPPGALVTASNTAPILAADAIQRAGGRPFARVVADVVLTPLGMTRSTLDAGVAADLGLAPGHGYAADDPRRGFSELAPPVDSVIRRPARGLHASPRDLARLAAALLAGGEVSGERGLPAEVVEAVLTPHARQPFTDPAPVWYGLGGRLVEWEGRRELRAGGSAGGHTVVFRLLPEDGLGVVAAANGGGYAATALHEIADVALRTSLGLPDARESRRARARPTAGAATAPTPLDLADPEVLVGTYRNGAETLELGYDHGGLLLVSGDLRLRTTVESDGALRARIADGRVAMVLRLVRDRENTLYLYYQDRAFRRVE